VTIQTAEFDGLGRRMSKRDQHGSVNMVTNAGGYAQTVVYCYGGQRIIEMRNDSGMMVSRRVGGPGLQTCGTDDTGIDSPTSEEVATQPHGSCARRL